MTFIPSKRVPLTSWSKKQREHRIGPLYCHTSGFNTTIGCSSPALIGSVGLVLGKSSTAFKGLRMIPDIVNSNYTGEI